MDMQHIIIDWLSLCSEFAIFGSLFIVPIRYGSLNTLNELLQCSTYQFNTKKNLVKSFLKNFPSFFQTVN